MHDCFETAGTTGQCYELLSSGAIPTLVSRSSVPQVSSGTDTIQSLSRPMTQGQGVSPACIAVQEAEHNQVLKTEKRG